MSTVINLTLRLGLLTPLHPAQTPPPPPPPPVVAVAPASVAAAPVASPTVAPVAPAPAPAPTVSNQLECVVKLADGTGNVVTFSPASADANGSCAAVQAEYPTAQVWAQAFTVTYQS